MSKISKRIKHTKIQVGYCLICGEYGRLSIDHVPPQGAITVGKIVQKHLTEVLGYKQEKIKGVKSSNGSKFKTICHKCNSSILGGCDDEIAKVNNILTEKIYEYFTLAQSLYPIVTANVNVLKYSRAMIGHILSATSVNDCRKEPFISSYFTPLQDFVLGKIDDISSTHDIYYWFMPSGRHISSKYIFMRSESKQSALSLLSFFPIAFLVAEKGKGIHPSHASKLEIGDEKLRLNLSTAYIADADFPFANVKGMAFHLTLDYQTIISFPIK